MRDHEPRRSAEPDETDIARAEEYALLAALLARAPDGAMLAQLSRLQGDASPLGRAHAALAQAAAGANPERITQEYFDLFIGVGRGELLPYGSYYLTGFLNERPLARLRETLAPLGIAREAGNADPEDHAAALCEIMAGIASRRFPVTDSAERDVFKAHLEPWLGRFFTDLEKAKRADFYRAVAMVGGVFIAIETAAFALPP